MRITYFTDTEEIGGAERYVADLAAAAIEAGHEVTMLAPQPAVLDFVHATAPAARLFEAGTREHRRRAGTSTRAAALAATLPRFAATLSRLDPVVVHVNNGGYPGSDLCRLAPLAARIAGVGPSAMTVNSMPWDRSRNSSAALQTAADALVWRTVDVVICPATIIGTELAERRSMPPGLIRKINYGAREPAGAGEAADELRRRLAPAGELLVGMVSARAIPEKGYDVYVEALSRAVAGIRAVLIGPHPGPSFVKRVEALGLGERLSLEGRVDAVDAYYHALDLIVMPSTAEECMPFVILEGMAAARPAFASRLAGTPEAIIEGETGRLFPPGDADALAALLNAAAGPERERLPEMGRRARSRWEALFSPERMVGTTLALYRELAGGGQAAGRRNAVSR